MMQIKRMMMLLCLLPLTSLAVDTSIDLEPDMATDSSIATDPDAAIDSSIAADSDVAIDSSIAADSDAAIDSGATPDCSTLNLEFKDTYARLLPHNFTDLALYTWVVNNGDVAHTLTAVTSPKAASGAFMSYYGPKGPKILQPMTPAKLLIPADGQLAFVPGQNHIRLVGYKDRPNPGDKINVTFTVDNACSVQVGKVLVKDRMTPTE